jgi:type II secretion system protein C
LIIGAVYSFAGFSDAFQSTADANYRNYFSRMTLIGIIIAEKAASTAAIFRNENSGEITILRVGETILDLELSEVFENRIIFKKGDETFQVFMGRGKIANVSKPSQVSSDDPKIPEKQTLPPDNIAETSAATKEFSRAEMEKKLEDEWPLLMQETRFVPYLAEGRISGFRITQMSDKSLLYEIGVRTDDIIKEVNGVELDSLETVMQLYTKFRDLNNFEVVILRRGKPLRFSYVLK